jgi:hypothetical protein
LSNTGSIHGRDVIEGAAPALHDRAAAAIDGMLRYLDEHHNMEESQPAMIRLDEYPAELVQTLLANDTAHPLLEMAHLDKRGYPFITVMGFALIDGKVVIGSRPNGLKLKRLATDPRCSMNYHNNVPRPEGLACLTLVGRAIIEDDREKVMLFDELLSAKVYRDQDPDADRRQAMIDSMHEADRKLVVLDEVEALYMTTPVHPSIPSGRPTPTITWRAADTR